MSKKVYVASGLDNYKAVLKLQHELRARGYEITFDWASLYQEQVRDRKYGPYMSMSDKASLAFDMSAGVLDANVVILLAPGKRGAHVEFGIAWGAGNKSMFVLNPDPANDISFYFLPGVKLVRLQEELLEEI